jgi:predicted enzyme related to lactoylglutathione lyase
MEAGVRTWPNEGTRVRFRVASARVALVLVEFPADDPDRARRFWSGVLGIELEARTESQGEGWQSSDAPALGIHARGPGPGDTRSLPYFEIDTAMPEALKHVEALGGTVIHPGETWAICKDTEGNPFALATA